MEPNNLLFHETFQPELRYISSILELSITGFTGDKYKISEITGIPTGKEKGKVEPHIRYGKYMGLIDYAYERGQYSLSPTRLGEEVWKQDKYLHEPLTLWLLHYMISRKKKGALQWEFVDKRVNSGFNVELSSSHLLSLAQKEFGLAASDATKAFSVVKNSYMSGCFSSLKFLDWDEKIKYIEKTEQIDFGYLYAYVLLDVWDDFQPEKKEITFTDMIHEFEYGKIFGLNDDDLDCVIETLERLNVVTLNRQLYPITIVRMEEKDSVQEKMYSLLL